MPFDIQGAKQAGYSDAEILPYLAKDHPQFDLAGAKKAGYSDTDVISFLTTYKPPPTSNAGMDMVGRLARGVGEIPVSTLKTMGRAAHALDQATPWLVGNNTGSLEQDPFYATGTALEGYLPKPDTARNDQLPAKAADFTGGLLGLLGTGYLGGLPSLVLGGGSEGAQSAADIAKVRGATQSQQDLNALLNFPVQGALNALPVGRLAGRFGSEAAGGLISKILKSGAENAAASGAGQAYQNAAALGTYNPKQDILEGVPQAAEAGAIGGALLGGVAHVSGNEGRVKEAQLKADTEAEAQSTADMYLNQEAARQQNNPLTQSNIALPAPAPERVGDQFVAPSLGRIQEDTYAWKEPGGEPGYEWHEPTTPENPAPEAPVEPGTNLTPDLAPAPTEQTNYSIREIPVETKAGPKSSFAVIEHTPNPEAVPNPDGSPAEPAYIERPVQTFPTRGQAEAHLQTIQNPDVTPEASAQMVQKKDQLFSQLRSRLRNLGIDDKAALEVRSTLGSNNDVVQGTYNPVQRLISLARDIYNPNLSDNELLSSMSGVLDHESVHAMRDMGLLTQDEWDSLTKEVASRKYQRGDDKRDYTYLDWAKHNYPDADPDLLHEEAVADMFKQWVGSGAKPNARYTGILNKLGNAVNSITRTVGKSDRLLDNMNQGIVGAREAQPLRAQTSPVKELTRRFTPEQAQELLSVVKASQPAPIGLQDQASHDRQAMEIAGQYSRTQDVFAKGLKRLGLNEEKSRDVLDEITRKLQDQLNPLARFQTDVLQSGGKIKDSTDAYLAATGYHGKTAAAMKSSADDLYAPAVKATVNVKATPADLKSLGRISKLAEQEMAATPGNASRKLTNLYMYALHAKERNAFVENVRQAEIISKDANDQVVKTKNEAGSGMANDEADKILDWFSKYPKLEQIKQAASKVQAVIADTRLTRIRSGLSPDYEQMLSDIKGKIKATSDLVAEHTANGDNDAAKEAGVALKGLEDNLHTIPDFEHYVPLRGHAEGEDVEHNDTRGALTGTGFKVRGLEDPHAMGRMTYAGDILANTVDQHSAAIIRGNKNEVGQRLGKFIGANKDQTEDWAKLHYTLPESKRLQPNGKVGWGPDITFSNKPNVFMYKVDGKPVYAEFKGPKGEEIANSLSNMAKLGDNAFDAFVRNISSPMNAIRNMATAWNPQFTAKNFIRDWQEASVKALQYDPKASAYIAANAPGTLKNLLAGDKETRARLKELESFGGTTGGWTSKSLDKTMDQIAAQVRQLEGAQTKAEKYMAPIKAIGSVLEHYNGMVEGATRLTVYDAFRKQGYTPERAAQMSKELTVNFDRKGAWGPGLNGMYLFFNANMQGNAGMMRALVSSKRVRRAGAALIAAGFAEAAINDALDKEDEDGHHKYAEMPSYIKDKNFILMNPSAKDGYYKIPKLQGFGFLTNIGRRVYETGVGRTDPVHAALSTMGNMADAFNPMGSTNPVTLPIPSMARPAVEAMINQSWTGQSIHPDSGYGVQKAPSQSFYENASPFSRTVANVASRATGGDGSYMPGLIEAHPNDIDYVLNNYLGGVGRTLGEAYNLMDFGVHPTQRQAAETAPTAQDIPFVRDFYGTAGVTGNRQAYQRVTEPYTRITRSMDDALKSDDPEAYMAYMKRYGDKLPQAELVKDMESERLKVNRELQDVQKDVQLPADQKLQIVKALRAQEDMIMGQTLKQLRAINAQPH